jgi:hypothetical protein
MVNAHWPAASGVTLNDVPLDGVIVATELHEFDEPAAGVDAVKFPL